MNIKPKNDWLSILFPILRKSLHDGSFHIRSFHVNRKALINMNLPLIIFSQILSLPVLASVFLTNIRLAPALILQVAVATELLVVHENIGVFSAGTLVIHHSQNVTILTFLPTLMSYRTYALTASTQFKADFGRTNMSKIEMVFRLSLYLRFVLVIEKGRKVHIRPARFRVPAGPKKGKFRQKLESGNGISRATIPVL